jgi:prepilin-type N-terminal cleavage/methylation domain-containing protein
MKTMSRFRRVSQMQGRRQQPGFTLIEAMIAVVVLVFGLVAISQLFMVAAASNGTANRATAAAAEASQQMERLMAVPFDHLTDGGGVDGAAGGCGGNIIQKDVPGAGPIWTCWRIAAVNGDLRFIQVRSQAVGLFPALTRAEFSTFRSRNGLPPGAAAAQGR